MIISISITISITIYFQPLMSHSHTEIVTTFTLW